VFIENHLVLNSSLGVAYNLNMTPTEPTSTYIIVL